MLEISTIPDDFLINAPFQSNALFLSDFLLHGLRLHAGGSGPLRLLRLDYGLRAGGRLVRQVSYPEEALADRLAALPAGVGQLRGCWAQLFLGRERFWDLERLATSCTLEPGNDAGMFNEHFLTLHSAPIEALEVRVAYEEDGRAEELVRVIPVVQHRNQAAYSFPVSGVWQVNGNYDCIVAHRRHYSMEFALDVAQLDLAPDALDRTRKDEDHAAFGQPVLAVGDGEVVACFNDMPKRVQFSMDAAQQARVWEERKALIAEYGFLAQQCGNHVVIRHAGGEHSFYGHLMYRSVTVSPGAKVVRGQPIGRVGNTGSSGCPHLHFQLMNGPDFLAARGLPCAFANIRNQEGQALSLIQEEYTVVWAV